MSSDKGPLVYTTLDETELWHVASPGFLFRDTDSMENLSALLGALNLAKGRVREEISRRVNEPFVDGEVQR